MGEGKEFLIDTNIFIEYAGALLPDNALDLMDAILYDKFYISVINKIELLGFSDLTQQEYKNFESLLKKAAIVGLDGKIVDKTIDLRRKYKIKLPDAIIAATALTHNLVLLTRNIKDFHSIDQLDLLNPHDL